MKRLFAVLWWIVSLGAGLFGILSVIAEVSEPSLWLGILALASLTFALTVNPLFVRKIQIRHKPIVMRAIAVGAMVAGMGSLISALPHFGEPIAQEAPQVQSDEAAKQVAATDSEEDEYIKALSASFDEEAKQSAVTDSGTENTPPADANTPQYLKSKLPQWQAECDAGNATSCFHLAYEHTGARGKFAIVAQNDAEAVRLYRKACDLGHSDSCYFAGLGFRDVEGTKDRSLALKYLEAACKQDVKIGSPCDDFIELSSPSPVTTGETATTTAGATTQSSLDQVRAAAEQGDADAQTNLGVMYENGKGVAKDYAQAAVWYRKAAEQGGVVAQYSLGTMYETGRGVARDHVQAFAWYSKAAERGNAEAQYHLGELYIMGIGTAPDNAQAVAWIRKAAAQGLPDAQSVLDSLNKN